MKELQGELSEVEQLLKENEANIGMATFITSRPVELLPNERQKKLVDGLCTAGNLQVFSAAAAKFQSLTIEEKDKGKVEQMSSDLTVLIEGIRKYQGGGVEATGFAADMRTALKKPIPESEDGLRQALAHQLEALEFLSSQDLSSKDEWDRLVDCVQLHNAIERIHEICGAYKERASDDAQKSALTASFEYIPTGLNALEDAFGNSADAETFQRLFHDIFGRLEEIWKGAKGEA